MHPALSRKLTLEQLKEALQREGLFGNAVRLQEEAYPLLFVRFTTVTGGERLLRFDATNYDFQPLEIEPVDPVTRAPLDAGVGMKRGGQPFPPHPLQGGRPFLCLLGTRSYYTHPSHTPKVTSERWERHRRDMRIVDMLVVIRDRFATGQWA